MRTFLEKYRINCFSVGGSAFVHSGENICSLQTALKSNAPGLRQDITFLATQVPFKKALAQSFAAVT